MPSRVTNVSRACLLIDRLSQAPATDVDRVIATGRTTEKYLQLVLIVESRTSYELFCFDVTRGWRSRWGSYILGTRMGRHRRTCQYRSWLLKDRGWPLLIRFLASMVFLRNKFPWKESVRTDFLWCIIVLDVLTITSLVWWIVTTHCLICESLRPVAGKSAWISGLPVSATLQLLAAYISNDHQFYDQGALSFIHLFFDQIFNRTNISGKLREFFYVVSWPFALTCPNNYPDMGAFRPSISPVVQVLFSPSLTKNSSTWIP